MVAHWAVSSAELRAAPKVARWGVQTAEYSVERWAERKADHLVGA